MKTIDMSNPVVQRLARAIVLKTIRDRYNLHARGTAKLLEEEAKRYRLTALELFQFLEENLPILLNEYLENMKRILKEKPSS